MHLSYSALYTINHDGFSLSLSQRIIYENNTTQTQRHSHTMKTIYIASIVWMVVAHVGYAAHINQGHRQNNIVQPQGVAQIPPVQPQQQPLQQQQPMMVGQNHGQAQGMPLNQQPHHQHNPIPHPHHPHHHPGFNPQHQANAHGFNPQQVNMQAWNHQHAHVHGLNQQHPIQAWGGQQHPMQAWGDQEGDDDGI